MALSNTATPKYYGMFREQVMKGNIPICKEIEMEMWRIDNLIANPRYYYDDEAVEGWVEFCETECTLRDGSPLKLLDTFKLWAEQVLGWWWFETKSVYEPNENGYGGHYVKKRFKHRLTKKQYLIIARGAAKSMYGSLWQNYFLNVDGSTTHQITVAPTMIQANEILAPIKTSIIRAPGPFFKLLTFGSLQNTTGSKMNRTKLAATKKGIENFLTGSLLEVRPLKIDKLQGLNVKCATVDEWLSGDLRENPINAIEEGCTKGDARNNPDDYLILAISSEGTVRNGSGDDIKMGLMKILRNEFDDDEDRSAFDDTSIWYYKLDDISEVGKPETWLKANPNIGATVSFEAYQKAVARAENFPAERNEILAKRFNLPMEGRTFFFRYDETLLHKKREYWGLPCALGADLSQGDDFCAFTFMFPLRDGSFGIKCRSYVSSVSMGRLPMALREKYHCFLDEGSLIVLEGTILDLTQVYEDLDAFIIESEYDVRCFGFDPYNAKEFVARWEAENGPFGIEKVIQGAKTESVPLGELKILAEKRMLAFDQELMKFCMGNCITLEDTNGNRKLSKERRDRKIDNVSAMMDAYVAWKANKDAFE